jgi:hypothetical protein
LNNRPQLVVYSRPWCHLCDDMITELRALPLAGDFELQVIDVESDPQLEERYGLDIPVLMADRVELCRHRLNAPKVNEYLKQFR